MKIIPLEQGSQAWLDWRKTVITATDCPAILGSSPWTTAYKCWQRKLELVEDIKSNEAMERGKRLEPQARASFVERYGFNMEPAVVESSEYDFLGASLDGISSSGRTILEIKCGGSKLHTMAAIGRIPDYYMHQMQHQLLVTGAEKCYYYSYDGKNGICIEVLPDPEFVDKFMPKARAFWKGIAFFEPPALEDRDYRNMNDSLDWNQYTKMYREVSDSLKVLEEKKDYLRKQIINLCADQSCFGNGIKVVKAITKGRIDYEQIPEIKDLDLNKYRKNSSTTWKFLLE
jgi:putative phage-type endonuclease